MQITNLQISGFRNIQSSLIEAHPGINMLAGDNGAGKTAVLESIYCLSTGYSFRTRKIKELINHSFDSFSILGKLHNAVTQADHRAGLQKNRSGDTSLKLNYEAISSMAEMTRLLPVKALFPDSHKLIQEGPSIRRQFLDWGLFHVEPLFFEQWRIYRRALDQRNKALRSQLADSEIKAWNPQLIESGNWLSSHRQTYVDHLQPWVAHYLQKFGLMGNLETKYKTGWSDEKNFEESLESSFKQCLRFKTTTVGPHRAEYLINFDGLPAKSYFSRGQQKLLVYALHFAQLGYFAERSGRSAVVLCDDLSAELDVNFQNGVIDCLHDINMQAFITANSPIEFRNIDDYALFHVKHGEISG